MKRVLEIPFHFFVVVLGLYFLSGIGSLLAYDTELLINVAGYLERLDQTLTEIMNPSFIQIYWGEGNKQYPISEVFASTYSYSFLLLFSSFLLAILMAVILSYTLMLLPRNAYRFSSRIVNVLDALPDVFIVVLFQLFIIWLFKETGLLVFDIYALGEERIYILPILCLSVLPVVFLLKQFLFQLKEEETKPYVEFSYSKGFRKSYTVWHHLFRNVWVHFFFHLKPIFLLMLSNLLIIELLFNINGFMQTLLRTATNSPAAFFLGMLLIFIPFFIVFTLGSMILSKWLNGGEQHE
ncbi:ABC transporter permease subunit [Bacillus sp. RO3]|nr:ABC transporter permease subunit [Bacillus sp. RO3]